MKTDSKAVMKSSGTAFAYLNLRENRLTRAIKVFARWGRLISERTALRDKAKFIKTTGRREMSNSRTARYDTTEGIMSPGDALKTVKPIRSQKTGVLLPREGTFVRAIENLGRRLILVNFGNAGEEYLFPDEVLLESSKG
jgi:hypothetical protein